MQDYSPQVPWPVHLLLLLLLSVPPVSALLPRHGQPPQYQEEEEEEEDVLQYCDGDFDIYFIFDKSSSVQEWSNMFIAWEDMAEKYVNPNLRMSFILFDSQATVTMPLTADRKEIRQQLTKVKKLLIQGSTRLEKGLEKANEQIKMVNSGAIHRSSLIIIAIWGDLSPQVLTESKKEADKARSMGAYVYCIGMDSYDRKKLNEIADNEVKVFVVEGHSTMFHGLVDTIGTLTCLELRSVEPSPLCIRENHPVALKGYGFHNAESLNQIICRFKFSGSKVVDKNPIAKNFTVVICPRPEIKQPGQTILVEVSLNRGKDFFVHTIPVNTSDCGPPPVTATTVPKTTPATPETTILGPNPVPTILRPRPPTSPGLPPPSPSVPAIFVPPAEPSREVLLSTLVLALLHIPVLLWWIWWLCCRKPPKALPAPAPAPGPQPKPREKIEPSPPVSPPVPAPPPVTMPPTVIICCCCCTCQDVYVSRGTEGNAVMYNFNPLSCYQLPLMWSGSGDQGQCTNLDLWRALCSHGPCTAKARLPPRREHLPLASCSQCHHLLQDSCSRPTQETP